VPRHARPSRDPARSQMPDAPRIIHAAAASRAVRAVLPRARESLTRTSPTRHQYARTRPRGRRHNGRAASQAMQRACRLGHGGVRRLGSTRSPVWSLLRPRGACRKWLRRPRYDDRRSANASPTTTAVPAAQRLTSPGPQEYEPPAGVACRPAAERCHVSYYTVAPPGASHGWWLLPAAAITAVEISSDT